MKVRSSVLKNGGESFKLASLFPNLVKNHKISKISVSFFFFFF